MKILCLYNNDLAIELFDWLKESGHETVLCSESLDAIWCKEQSFDLTVSYTYRYVLTKETINALKNNVVNIHNSFLPWNRGADPNIWSILDDTPRGATLHLIDEKLDHGDIIAQTLLPAMNKSELTKEGNAETLLSTYKELDKAAKDLFKAAFSYYPFWNSMRKTSSQLGSYHKSSEMAEFKSCIRSFEIKMDEAKGIYHSLTAPKPRGGDFGGLMSVRRVTHEAKIYLRSA